MAQVTIFQPIITRFLNIVHACKKEREREQKKEEGGKRSRPGQRGAKKKASTKMTATLLRSCEMSQNHQKQSKKTHPTRLKSSKQSVAKMEFWKHNLRRSESLPSVSGPKNSGISWQRNNPPQSPNDCPKFGPERPTEQKKKDRGLKTWGQSPEKRVTKKNTAFPLFQRKSNREQTGLGGGFLVTLHIMIYIYISCAAKSRSATEKKRERERERERKKKEREGEKNREREREREREKQKKKQREKKKRVD